MIIFVSGLIHSQTKIPTPSEFLKFEVGADRQLADYRQIVSYFRALDQGSDRIELERIGETTLGNDLMLAVISSESNIKERKKYQEIAEKLADPRGLSQAQIDHLARSGKLILLVTCNIHASEIGASQMAMEWAHALAATNDPKVKRWLDDVILLLIPSLNPDGQIMETEWYRKNLGTKHEGMQMPWLYHHYVGHDNNRDWYMLTQKETIAMNRAVYFEWFPQVWLDEHQMGSTGPRIFTPPFSSPVDSDIHPLIWRAIDHIGTTMSWRLEERGKSGVIYGYSFDAYWPGGTKNTGWWKNIAGLLTEVASARLASPIEIAAGELSGGNKGLVDYRRQINFPNPWPGGVWRLRDIMDYERIVSDALLEACSTFREEFLRMSATVAMAAISAGKPGEYFQISLAQDDANRAARLAHLMRQHNVEVRYSASDRAFYIPTAQPYGKFVSEMLGTQRYAKVRLSAEARPLPPYDTTSWSLPLLMGVKVERTMLPSDREKTLRLATDADWPAGALQGSGASSYLLASSSNNASSLVNELLKRKGNVTVSREPFESGGTSYPAGTFIIEPQSELPSLAEKYHLVIPGVLEKPKTSSFKLKEVRVGLYKPWIASMDEGWTRWILEQYQFNAKNVGNKEIQGGNLNASFEAIILPDVEKDVIVEGRPRTQEGDMKYFTEFPADYAGGIAKEGVKHLKEFVEKGGMIITLASSGDLLMDEFNIPVQNALSRTRPEEFSCPGASLRVFIDQNHPVNHGMPKEASAFLNERIAYRTVTPSGDVSRTVLAWYPEDAEDILQSGWILGAEKLERRAAAVAMTYGKGKLVLFGFRVQHRAQTEGTFKMLFNAIHWAGMN
jgi:hypothetical protein